MPGVMVMLARISSSRRSRRWPSLSTRSVSLEPILITQRL